MASSKFSSISKSILSTQGLRISLYLVAFLLSNLIVLHFGAKGLIFTAIFLIPFDFVIRCLFHETWKGLELIFKMGGLVLTASLLTYIVNQDSLQIAIASSVSFCGAQIVAGLFYQSVKKKSRLLKVNGSDAVGVLTDSIIFQLVAFSAISLPITASQFLLKVVGGLIWYYILIEKMNLIPKTNARN